jgi:hypothetical protein
MYLVVTAYLVVCKQENEVRDEEAQLGIRGVYNTIWKICKLPRKVYTHYSIIPNDSVANKNF